MKYCFKIILCVAAVLCAGSEKVNAEAIGVASEVVRSVLGSTGGTFKPLDAGDTVFRDQTIRSGHDGSALLTLEDASVVAVGPSSDIVLDAFVAPGGVRGVSVAQGVFRFISGPAQGGTHAVVRTPHASIAVRGTRFDVRVLRDMTTIVLAEGAVDVCRKRSCRALQPGEAVDVTAAGIYPSATGQRIRWTFLSGGTPGLRHLAEADAASAAGRNTAAAARATSAPSFAFSSSGSHGGPLPAAPARLAGNRPGGGTGQAVAAVAAGSSTFGGMQDGGTAATTPGGAQASMAASGTQDTPSGTLGVTVSAAQRPAVTVKMTVE